MADPAPFDLRVWLNALDVSAVDDSLDDSASRLFLLNRVLTSPSAAPLAALIVYSPMHTGLHVLLDFAHCSDPRLAVMALTNVLHTLNGDAWKQAQLSLSDEDEDIDSQHDFLSSSDARVRIASVLSLFTDYFLEMVSEGDFCPDYLFYILTLLMELSKDCDNFPEVHSHIAPIPTTAFLKCIMRTWKTPDRSDHSTVDEKDKNTLGFLVSCYLGSLCASEPDCHDGAVASDEYVLHSQSDSDSDVEPVGLSALMTIKDWAIKFIIMRLFQSPVDIAERATLIAVLSECAARDRPFAEHLLKLSILPTMKRCFTMGLDNTMSNDTIESDILPHRQTETVTTTTTTTTTTTVTTIETDSNDASSTRPNISVNVRHVLPYILLLNTLIDLLLPEPVRPGCGITRTESDPNPAKTLLHTIWDILGAGVRIALQAEFPDTLDGGLFMKSVIAVVGRLVVRVWRVIIAVHGIERVSLLTTYMRNTIVAVCRAHGVSWQDMSQSCEMAPIRVGILLCDKVASAGPTGAHVRLASSYDDEDDMSDSSMCECCMTEGTDAQLCQACHRVSFCDSRHQLMLWKAGHQHECSFFQNRLEGCSFTLVGERIEGLQKLTTSSKTDGPFAGIVDSQRKELLVLGFQLPGVFIETLWEGRVIEVLYVTRQPMLAKLGRIRDTRERKATAAVLTACLSIIQERCFLYVKVDGMTGSETLRVYTGSSDESQCLSSALL